MEDNPGPDIKMIILGAFLLSIGVLCNILACVIWKNWLLFIVVVAYFLAPIPNVLFARCGDPMDMSGSNRSFKDLGYFLTGVFVVSGFALPAVLTHIQIIAWQALILSLAGGLIVYGTILAYLHKYYNTTDQF